MLLLGHVARAYLLLLLHRVLQSEATRGNPRDGQSEFIRLDSTRLSVVRHRVHVAPCQPMDGAHPNSTQTQLYADDIIVPTPDHGNGNGRLRSPSVETSEPTSRSAQSLRIEGSLHL
jgi:hypothetical protein